ncbi:Uu.00g140650.m01.CDS01 [Anthostomella pinea]|uniref:Uu.00g140650.m01.CDS01 n=1 Tax=Anthostomella pinea TaxID=933095 RepID=A0AAI8VQS6_9PEZI|nr:Uu.00g140650.m01.CDS01 [Anthostomella pinea]
MDFTYAEETTWSVNAAVPQAPAPYNPTEMFIDPALFSEGDVSWADPSFLPVDALPLGDTPATGQIDQSPVEMSAYPEEPLMQFDAPLPPTSWGAQPFPGQHCYNCGGFQHHPQQMQPMPWYNPAYPAGQMMLPMSYPTYPAQWPPVQEPTPPVKVESDMEDAETPSFERRRTMHSRRLRARGGHAEGSLRELDSEPSQKEVAKKISSEERLAKKLVKQALKERRIAQGDLPESLETPLSELLRDVDAQDIDIEAFANRSIQTRLRENQNSGGRIKRPVNAFLLYRKAIQNRVKAYLKGQNGQNHQLISSYAGLGWKSETPEVREWYRRLAAIEKKNHGKAFPTYKFHPGVNKSKKAAARKARETAAEDSESELSELSDSEF